jgi:hypothetical protein
MDIRRETFIGGRNREHLVILTRELGEGEESPGTMHARRSWGFFALRAPNNKLVGFLKWAALNEMASNFQTVKIDRNDRRYSSWPMAAEVVRRRQKLRLRDCIRRPARPCPFNT